MPAWRRFGENCWRSAPPEKHNVQLPVSDKANQMGCFEDLKELLDARNPAVSDRVAWKTNDGGDIKAQTLWLWPGSR